jgi:hypothetical protein
VVVDPPTALVANPTRGRPRPALACPLLSGYGDARTPTCISSVRAVCHGRDWVQVAPRRAPSNPAAREGQLKQQAARKRRGAVAGAEQAAQLQRNGRALNAQGGSTQPTATVPVTRRRARASNAEPARRAPLSARVGDTTKATTTTAVQGSVPKKRGRASNAEPTRRAPPSAQVGETTKATATTAVPTKRTVTRREDSRTPLIQIHRPKPTAASASASAALSAQVEASETAVTNTVSESVPQKRGFPGNAERARRASLKAEVRSMAVVAEPTATTVVTDSTPRKRARPSNAALLLTAAQAALAKADMDTVASGFQVVRWPVDEKLGCGAAPTLAT